MPKKQKVAPEFEYRLILGTHIDELRQVPFTRVILETTKLFASFRYELSVEERITGKEIHYTILGLKAPHLSLPASGTGQFIRDYELLKGKRTFVVENLDGTTNAFVVQFTPKHINVLQSPKHPFVELVIT
jgi:hypothetical protein